MNASFLINKNIPVEVINQTADKIERKLAYPKGLLEIDSFKNYDPFFFTRSIGYDGFLYGAQGVNTIARSNDGGATIELGYEFELPGYTIRFVTNTPSGYVVGFGGDSDAQVYFSESFDSGFTKVLDMPNNLSGGLGNHFYNEFSPYFDSSADNNINYKGIVLLGEYQIGTSNAKAYASFDGGRTFETIYTAEIVDEGVNCHIHVVSYDHYRDRIWVVVGDGVNGKIVRSDDLGDTWVTASLELPKHSTYPRADILTQPTLMIPLREKVAICPDGTPTPSIVSINMDNKFTRTGTEKYEMQLEYSIVDNIHSGSLYGYSPYAKQGEDIAYTVFSGRGKSHIMATGDGGNSWHRVLTLSHKGQTGILHGILGVDKDGFLYASYSNNGTRLLKLKALEWDYSYSK